MLFIEECFLMVLYNIVCVWCQVIDWWLKDFGVGQVGWLVIVNIVKFRQVLLQIELVNCLGVEGLSVVSLVDWLVKVGFVECVLFEIDWCIKYVVLIEVGQQFYVKVRIVVDVYCKELFVGIDGVCLLVVVELLEEFQVKVEVSL